MRDYVYEKRKISHSRRKLGGKLGWTSSVISRWKNHSSDFFSLCFSGKLGGYWEHFPVKQLFLILAALFYGISRKLHEMFSLCSSKFLVLSINEFAEPHDMVVGTRGFLGGMILDSGCIGWWKSLWIFVSGWGRQCLSLVKGFTSFLCPVKLPKVVELPFYSTFEPEILKIIIKLKSPEISNHNAWNFKLFTIQLLIYQINNRVHSVTLIWCILIDIAD